MNPFKLFKEMDMNKQLLVILASAFALLSFTSDKPAYTLYNTNGKEVKYSKMMKELQKDSLASLKIKTYMDAL